MVVARVYEAGHAVPEQLGAGQRRRHANVVAIQRRFVRVHAIE